MVILISLGESARHYISEKFKSLGTNLLIVLPGRSETVGGPPLILGETPRNLTLDDSLAFLNSPYITIIAPIIIGSAPVSWSGREREANILGSTADLMAIRHLVIAQGRFLPNIDPSRAAPACILGQVLRDELVGKNQALGEWIRIGDRRFRVIGILNSEGQSIGVDFDEAALIPVASAQVLFDSPALFRVLAEAKTHATMAIASDQIRAIIKTCHEGEDDVTIISQDSMVKTFDEILIALTYTVGGIAAISLASLWIIQRLYPEFEIVVPDWVLAAALVGSVGTGLLCGVIPASRAARLDPTQALAKR